MKHCVNRSVRPRDILKISLYSWVIWTFFSDFAYAYIDPGTSGFVFSFLGQILAVTAVFLGVFFRPVFRFMKYLLGKIKEYPKISIPVLIVILSAILFG